MIFRCILIVCFNAISLTAIEQTDSLNLMVDYRIDMSSKVIKALEKEYTSMHDRLGNASEKIFKKMELRETNLFKQFVEGCNNEKWMFLEEYKSKYYKMQDQLREPTDMFEKFPLKEYIPDIDSIQTALTFLKQTELPARKLQELEALNSSFKNLQNELQKANDIQAF